MIKKYITFLGIFFINTTIVDAQVQQSVIDNIQKEVDDNSQLAVLGQVLMDEIGPRLIGSPSYAASQDWLIKTYKSWGIDAWNEKYGQWKSWERGSTNVAMLYPRYDQLTAIQLAWCPSTPKNKAITGELIALPLDKDSIGFENWLSNVKGKIVLVSKPEISGRPIDNWEKNAMPEHAAKQKKERDSLQTSWNNMLKKIGHNTSSLPAILEKNGAIGILSSFWSGGWSSNRIFAAKTERIPNVDVSMEDYQMLYRLLSRGVTPKISMQTTSKDYGMQAVSNTMSLIKGKEKPEEYIMLSAHLDSWDGGTGATDNGTGTILMMEVMRILKKHYPNPKRSIIVGHWGGEEQGLNGSRAYIADHPEMRSKISVLFNQDNGTGRINKINGNGFLDAYQYFNNWVNYLPEPNRKEISMNFPGSPGGGGSDYASFIPYDIPAFFLLGNSWDYGTYTWHTQLDTYDKIAMDDLKMNAVTIATLVYLACEEPEMFSRRRATLPFNIKANKTEEWPAAKEANRTGKY